MKELTPDIFRALWQLTKAQQSAPDEDLARMQKFMAMHEDMHEHFERLVTDPQASFEVEGENILLHIAMDAAAERALETDQPPAIRAVMQEMLDANIDPGRAFHVIAQALQHAFLAAAAQDQETNLDDFLNRARQYAHQVRQRPVA